MKARTLAIAAAGAGLLALTGTAEANRINTGGPSGLYHGRFCPLLQKQLEKAQLNYTCDQSAGSRENISRVLGNPRQIGFSQLDVYALQTSGAAGRDLSIARADDIRECLFMVTKNKQFESFGDVAVYADKLRFVLPPRDSGSTATFEFLQKIDPDGLGRAKQITYAASTDDAVKQALAGEDVVTLFVQFPDPASPIFKLVNSGDGQMLPVIDRNILRQQIGDQKVYFAEETEVSQAKWVKTAAKVVTACTPLVIFTGSPERFADGRQRQEQADIIATVKSMNEDLLIPQEGFFKRMLKRSKQISAQSAEKFMDMSEKAREKARPALDKAKEMGGRAVDASKPYVEKAKEAAGQAYERAKDAAGTAAEKAKDAAERAKERMQQPGDTPNKQ